MQRRHPEAGFLQPPLQAPTVARRTGGSGPSPGDRQNGACRQGLLPCSTSSDSGPEYRWIPPKDQREVHAARDSYPVLPSSPSSDSGLKDRRIAPEDRRGVHAARDCYPALPSSPRSDSDPEEIRIATPRTGGGCMQQGTATLLSPPLKALTAARRTGGSPPEDRRGCMQPELLVLPGQSVV